MTSAYTQGKSLGWKQSFHIHSDQLIELRETVKQLKQMGTDLGTIAVFKLIVDTNVVLGDILWLLLERKNPSAKTQLMETIQAGTIEVYAPPLLISEVEQKIPLLASERGLSLVEMLEHWNEYKARIEIRCPDPLIVLSLKDSVDPDDIDFVALERTLCADGIFSKDHDIEEMGGRKLSITCITCLRDYSRATAMEFNIRVNSLRMAGVGVAAIHGAVLGAKTLLEGMKRAPDWAKALLFLAALGVALHPGARAAIGRNLQAAFAGIGRVTPALADSFTEIATLMRENQAEAMASLAAAMLELDPPKKEDMS